MLAHDLDDALQTEGHAGGGDRPSQECADQTIVAAGAADRADIRLGHGRFEYWTRVVVETAGERQIERVAVGRDAEIGQDPEELLQLVDRLLRRLRPLIARRRSSTSRLSGSPCFVTRSSTRAACSALTPPVTNSRVTPSGPILSSLSMAR